MAINKKLRQKVYDKYNGHCAYCGTEITYKQMQVDHIIPKCFQGGNMKYEIINDQKVIVDHTDDFENLNPSCKDCNNYKCHSSLETFRMYAKQMFNEKLNYLFKSKTKMQIAINFGVIKLSEWDGIFYFEKINQKNSE